MTASEPTPPIASPSPAAPLASQLAANPCSHPSFDQFVATIAALRAPDGCPWDRTQTHQSIAHNMIEEAYEAVDAIEAVDVAHLREELGDVLFSLVNVGRRMGVDAEGALRSTCRKFRDRWAWMEQAAWQQGRTIEDLSSEERETLWNEAKKRERS